MEDLLLALNEDDTIYTEIIKTNLSERKLLINTEISDALIERIVLMILKWNKEDKNLPVEKRKKIILYLNSICNNIGNQLKHFYINLHYSYLALLWNYTHINIITMFFYPFLTLLVRI